jgi:carbon-monoxide dehydrogenase medium subunit
MRFPEEKTRVLYEFGYFDPRRVAEAVSVLEELGERVMVLAGGTDLLNLMKLRQVTPEFLLNIKNIKGLDHIRQNRGLEIGALTRISTIKESELIRGKYMSIYEAAEWFGTPQIRNMATVGGNICRSSPSSDMTAPLMALDAVLKLVGPKGERKVPVEDFSIGAGENISDREIVTEIVVPPQEGTYGTAFRKLMRSSADLAKVSCAVRVTVGDSRCNDIRIVLGAVADKVFRAKAAEEIIRGEKITDEVIDAAAEEASSEAQPITDVRSTAAYRRQVIKVLVRRLIVLSIERAAQKRTVSHG